MSSCPRRYASKSLRSLKHPHVKPHTPEPLWFLYPSWVQPVPLRRYHTERASGQAPLSSFQPTVRRRGTATVRHLCHKERLPQSRDISSVSGRSHPHEESAQATNDTVQCHVNSLALVDKAVLGEDSIYRKVVPSTAWTRRCLHYPTVDGQERKAYYQRPLDLAAVLLYIRSMSLYPKKPDQHALRVALSDRAQKELVPGKAQENTWLHHDGSGCIVKYRPGYVELYGSERALEIAQKYFSDERHFARSHEHLEWIDRIRRDTYHAIADLPLPPTWTVRSVLDYVTQLTRSRLRRSAARTIYHNTGSSDHREVFKVLEDIFTRSDTCRFTSTQALNLALRYCRRHTESPTTAVHIWEAFAKTGLRPDVACFNQELGRCLVAKNPTRFQRIVLEMKGLRIQPDSTTWALVLGYADSRSSRAQIFRLIKNSGLLDSGEHENLVVVTAKREIQTYLGSQDGMRRFMEEMEGVFGPGWLTRRVLQDLLKFCRLRNPKVNPASEILSTLQAMGKTELLDSTCILELIRISAKIGELTDALHLVRLAALDPYGGIPQPAISVLFSLAWQKRYFNVCRLFWFAGATSGRITFDMQRLVVGSLECNVCNTEDPTEASWQLLAGKIIIGTDLDTEGFAKIFPTLSRTELQSTPVEWLLNWTPNDSSRREQLEVGQLLVERDLNAYRFFRRLPRLKFLAMLEKAVALDESWERMNAQVTKSPKELVAQAMQIELEERIPRLQPPRGNVSEDDQRRNFIVNGHLLNYDTLKYRKDEQLVSSTMVETCQTQSKHSTLDISGGVAARTEAGTYSQGCRRLVNAIPSSDNADMEFEQRGAVIHGLG